MQIFASPEAKMCIAILADIVTFCRVKPKTEEFLNFLLWSSEKLMRPTFRNLTDSYESWAYGNGLMRQAASLEKNGFIERGGNASDRLYRLTEEGRLHALGGRDPEAQWSRRWDGQWRLVIFDVPMECHVHRGRLRRYLRQRGFGCVQDSVWVTPDSVEGERNILADGTINVNSLIFMQARPCAGESDDDIVAGAWDFDMIDRRYAKHLKVLAQRPEVALAGRLAAESFRRWAADERQAWRAAIDVDPLLPRELWPSDYLGCRAWEERIKILQRTGEQLLQFSA